MMQSADPEIRWWVICLCAQWCGVCREWQNTFNETAAAYPQLHFAWVDIEDEADAMGDVDIETFPTILIAQGSRPLFLGPVQPSAGTLNRLIASLLQDPSASPTLPATTAALMQRLLQSVLPNP